MDVAVRWKQIVHDNKVDFSSMRELDPMQTIESRNESIRIVENMLVVILEDSAKELVLGMRDCFDDESIVSRKVEEGT